MIHGKSDIVRLRQQTRIIVLDFGDLLAISTDQKLGGALVTGVHATDEGVATFDTMDEPLCQQKIERAVNDRRRDAFAAAGIVQQGEDIVSTQRLVAGQQDFEHLPASRGQTQLALFADAPRRRQQLALAAAMIVLAEGDI